MRLRVVWALTLVGLFLASYAGHTRAESISVHVVAVVDDVEDPLGLVDSVRVGDPITIVYSYESTIPDLVPEDPTGGVYFDEAGSISAQIGDLTFACLDVLISVLNDSDFFDADVLSIGSEGCQPLDSGVTVLDLELDFFDSTRQALSSDAIPATPDRADYDADQVSIEGCSSGNPDCDPFFDEEGYFISGHVTSIPEPQQALLQAAALGALVLFGRLADLRSPREAA